MQKDPRLGFKPGPSCWKAMLLYSVPPCNPFFFYWLASVLFVLVVEELLLKAYPLNGLDRGSVIFLQTNAANL